MDKIIIWIIIYKIKSNSNKIIFDDLNESKDDLIDVYQNNESLNKL